MIHVARTINVQRRQIDSLSKERHGACGSLLAAPVRCGTDNRTSLRVVKTDILDGRQDCFRGMINMESRSLRNLFNICGPVDVLHACARVMPSLFILAMSVVRANPSLAPAPLGPPTTQLVAARA
jgi:hypothetical protein